MDIKYWSTASAGNSSAPPNGLPEGMHPSDFNDSMREIMASFKRFHDDPQWIDAHTPTYVNATSFTVAGDRTGLFSPGRRIKVSDGASTFYGNVVSSTYTGAASTGVYCQSTKGFTSSLSAVAVGIMTSQNRGIAVCDNAVLNDSTTTSAVSIVYPGSPIISIQFICPKSAYYNVEHEFIANHSSTGVATLQFTLCNSGRSIPKVLHKDYNMYQHFSDIFYLDKSITYVTQMSVENTSGNQYESPQIRVSYRELIKYPYA